MFHYNCLAQKKMDLEIKERDDKYTELDTKFNRLHKRAKQRIQEVQKVCSLSLFASFFFRVIPFPWSPDIGFMVTLFGSNNYSVFLDCQPESNTISFFSWMYGY